MTRDELIRQILPGSVDVTPQGFVALELSNDDFVMCADMFFDKILEISQADVTGIEGYGEFNENGQLQYKSFHEYAQENFANDNDGYWFSWREMFESHALDKEFFESYFEKMVNLSKFCEGKRYLVNNNTFYSCMITDGKENLGFPEWTRAGIMDFLMDIVLMDLEKPYFHVIERFWEYCKKRDIQIDNFRERYLCMYYLKALDGLRWHASIEDELSCQGIMNSTKEIEARVKALK